MGITYFLFSRAAQYQYFLIDSISIILFAFLSISISLSIIFKRAYQYQYFINYSKSSLINFNINISYQYLLIILLRFSISYQLVILIKSQRVPLCDTNIGARDRSFLLEIRYLSNLLWLYGKIFLIGTNGIQKFENLAYSHICFRFLIAPVTIFN